MRKIGDQRVNIDRYSQAGLDMIGFGEPLQYRVDSVDFTSDGFQVLLGNVFECISFVQNFNDTVINDFSLLYVDLILHLLKSQYAKVTIETMSKIIVLHLIEMRQIVMAMEEKTQVNPVPLLTVVFDA